MPNDSRLVQIDERLGEFEAERRNLFELGNDALAKRITTAYDDVRLRVMVQLRRDLDRARSNPDNSPQLGDQYAIRAFSHHASSLQHSGGVLNRLSAELTKATG